MKERLSDPHFMDRIIVRKSNNFIARCGLMLMLVCVPACVGSLAVSFPASASRETEEKIKKAKEEAQQTQNQINENQENISSLDSARSNLQDELNYLNGELTSIGEHLEDLREKIRIKTEEIATTTRELEEATKREEDQYASMKKRVQFMYENSRTFYLELFFGNGQFDFTDFLNRQDYAEQLSAYDRRMLDEYIRTKEEIDAKKALLEEEEQELQGLREETEAEQDRVSLLVSSTSGSIANYSGQIADAEALADSLKAQIDAQNLEIKKLEAQLAEERRLEQLSRQSVWRSIGDIEFAEGDRYLLANLIYCEAGNQPYDGQLAVGAVVINRVMSGAFPDTVVGVIYQNRQFAPVASGRLALALMRDDATPACYMAADEAMAGHTTVADCIFFRTPIPQITPRYTIGGHIFY